MKVSPVLVSSRVVLVLMGLLGCILSTPVPFPIPLPQNYEDAVRQAQQMSLIPKDSVIDRTSSATQVAYFKLGENDSFNQDDLRAVLEGIPPEVVASLESQVANVGRQQYQ